MIINYIFYLLKNQFKFILCLEYIACSNDGGCSSSAYCPETYCVCKHGYTGYYPDCVGKNYYYYFEF